MPLNKSESNEFGPHGDPKGWKKFGLFSCGNRGGTSYLHFEELWTPVLKARLSSHAWLDDTGWQDFIRDAEIGEVFDGKGTIIVVRLKELRADFEQGDQ